MLPLTDHIPISITDVGGIYARDSFYDSVPQDHWIDSLNIDLDGNGFKTRDGFSKTITLSNLRQIEIYKREGEATRVLLLNSSGALFDATNSLVSPILNIASMVGFSIQTFYNRCFITPHNGVKGLSGEFIYIYQGTSTARKAAGVAPVGTFTATLGSSGKVDAGTHLIAISYETDSGFITPPGEVATIVTDGTKQIDLTNIPVGPTGIAKRRVLMSQAIQDFNGNVLGYEMFFVPGGTINDNTTTIFTIDVYDEELISTADYLFDQLEEIPAGCSLGKFRNRMVICGPNENPSIVLVSNDTEPESFNSLAGFLICDPFETEGVKNCIEFRDSLYLFKGNPGHTYATSDNGFEASTWDCPRIDSSIGADIQGVAQFTDSKGSNSDFFLVADLTGLFLFNGSYQKQFSLSYKISKIWGRINKAYMWKVKMVLDPINFKIYISVPLDSATAPNYLLVADYTAGLDPENIVWLTWNSVAFSPQSIVVDINNTTKRNVLTVCGTSNVYRQVVDQYNDEGSAIDNYVVSASLFSELSWVHHFGAYTLNIQGDGTPTISIYTKDLKTSSSAPSFALDTIPGRIYTKPINVNSERASIKVRLNSANKYFKCKEYTLYARPVWATRPN